MIWLQVPPPVPISVPVPVVGDRAPDVTFRQMDGKPLRLSSLKGWIVVLEFTAFSCPPCRELAPHLEEMAARMTDIVFLTVSTDAPAVSKKLFALRPKGARTVFLQDPYAQDRSKMGVWKFGNVAVPTLFVIGRDGTMASRLMQDGVQSLPRLEARIAWARARP